MMKTKSIILGIGVMLGILLPGLQASEWDKKTIVTFPEPMRIPGTVLPAGEYVIKRADGSMPNVIQFTNMEETEVFATVHALPTMRQKPSDKVEIITEERPTGSPEALKKWFYPGDLTGAEFVYPKSELLASATTPRTLESEPAATHSHLEDQAEEQASPSASEQGLYQPGWGEAEEAEVQAEDEEPVVIAQAQPPATPAYPAATSGQEQAQEPAQEELPQTATSLTLAGMLGGLAVFGGALLRRFSQRLG